MARGARVYATFCVPCHGVSGKGDGLVALRGFPPPASLMAEKAVNMEDGQMFHVLSFGQGNMASYAAQIPREDRWKVILYVRSLQEQSTQETVTVEESPAASAAAEIPAPGSPQQPGGDRSEMPQTLEAGMP